MKNQIFVLSFMFCLLLVGLGQIYGQSEQSIASLSVVEKRKLVKDYLRRNGLDQHGIPEIVIGDLPDGVYGLYESQGSTPKYDQDVIILDEQTFSSLGELEVTIRHEMRHYWIDHGRVPAALEEECSTLLERTEAAFDFSQFERDVRKALAEQIAAIAAQLVEEWFISQGILEETSVYEDPENARAGAELSLKKDKEKIDKFWTKRKILIQDKEEYVIAPGSNETQVGATSNGDEAAADNPYAKMNMAGDYDCVSGLGCEGDRGTIVYDNGGSKMESKHTPMVVTQQGAQISMKSVLTTETEGANSKTMKATAVKSRQEHGGTATITGREFTIQWVTRIVSTGGSHETRDFDGNIIFQMDIPPKDETWTDTATIRILREGAFELIRVDNNGKTNVWRYVRG